MAIAVAGTLVIVGGGFDGGSRALLGDVLALAGAVFAAIYVLLGRSLRQELSLVTYSSVVYATSAVALAAMMIASRTAFTGYPAKTWLVFVLITAGPQFLGHTTFNYLLGHVRASIVAVALLAWMILGEAPGPATVVGGVIVLAGVYVAIAAETRAADVVAVE